MSSNKISFKLENKLSELKMMCRQVEAFVKKQALSPKDIFEIHLCMEEHFTNIISHGYADSETHWIEVALSVEDEKFMVRIEDDGIAFNPTKIVAPNFQCPLEERKIGGLGVHLTRHFMDTMAYQRRGNKNILVMTKKIEWQAEGS
ncbi:MAG: ATP-binding protein [Desulfobacterales bacterium]|nr:ATP-binding protein [Desulfobacterales bacterium]